MSRAMVRNFGIRQQRSFWLRCFLGKAWFVMAVLFAASSLCWARIEMPGPLHLWRLHGFFVSPAGKPMENVEVTLVRDGTILYKTRTDGSGRFSFDHIHGRYLLHIDKSDYSQLAREVIVGLDTVTLLRRNTLYVIAGPGACTDDCSAVYTNKSDFEKAVKRNTKQHD